ncbi:Storkhead-box protein 1-like protein [Dinothrombium tinctorium]|uniref:Storkhead-box protein 1-like protein n=1 Tax=Dinothrombium tinctorium TaxID=1965070 RepID=A0A3S3PRN4_9ACAR|nr:Storkhead-box protein 1-like protein [Dinothrombium tinctorium]RWS15187.1 Storkhead-box protein 1-like protein [Dinothrombium tinctorium]
MSPHTGSSDAKFATSITLLENCVVLSLRKSDVFGCHPVTKLTSNNYQWPSDGSDRAMSPDASTLSAPSPCLSYSPSEVETIKQDQFNGWSVFQSFVKENSKCYWNPSLIASVNSIEFRGFVLPSTIIVSGSEYDLETIRSCWARMTLKAPNGYAIQCLGDMASLEIVSVNQTHFTPLSEALCSSIHSLNVQGIAAFPHVICDSLRQNYPHLMVPSLEVIKKALKSLQKERKLRYISSRGYVVVPPPENYTNLRAIADSDEPKNRVPILMSNEEAIRKLHGAPTEEEITFRSFGVQVDMSKLLSSPSSSGVTAQYALDVCTCNGDTLDSNDGTSLKRSSSLRMHGEKARSEEKGFSFMRSRSLKLNRDKRHKSSSVESTVKSGDHKKTSMFTKLITRFSSHSSGSRKTLSASDLESKKSEKESRGTQTLERQKSISASSFEKKNEKSETLKSLARQKSFSNSTTYCMPCACCNSFPDSRKFHPLNVYSDYCVCESSRYLCYPTLDPNCEHCIASFASNACCNEYLTSDRYFEKGVKMRPPIARPPLSPSGTIRPKTPLKLNNNKTVNNEKMKPIAMQTNALHKESNAAPTSEQTPTTTKDIVNYDEKKSREIVSNNENTAVHLIEKSRLESVKNLDIDEKYDENRSDVKSDNNCNLLSGNSVNVKIEIDSNTTSSPLTKKDTDAIFTLHPGRQLASKEDTYTDPKPFKRDSPSTPKKLATVTSTTVTATMTVPNVTVSDSNHNFTVNTVTRTKTMKREDNLVENFKPCSKQSIVINDFTNKHNFAKDLFHRDVNRVSNDRVSPLSSIREKVAKAKAEFFKANNSSSH